MEESEGKNDTSSQSRKLWCIDALGETIFLIPSSFIDDGLDDLWLGKSWRKGKGVGRKDEAQPKKKISGSGNKLE